MDGSLALRAPAKWDPALVPANNQDATMPRPRKVATTPTFPCSLAAALSRQPPSQGEPRLGRRVTCPWPWIVRPTPPPPSFYSDPAPPASPGPPSIHLLQLPQQTGRLETQFLSRQLWGRKSKVGRPGRVPSGSSGEATSLPFQARGVTHFPWLETPPNFALCLHGRISLCL